MLLLACSLLGACALLRPSFEKPELSVIDVRMLDGNFFQQNFLLRLKVRNPNDRAIPINSVSADLKVGGEPFASGTSNKAFTVAAFGEAEFEMTVQANMALAVIKLLGKSDRQTDAIDYELDGKVSIELPFLRSLPFHQQGSLPLKN
jgi:LEA14-like dessication related protein